MSNKLKCALATGLYCTCVAGIVVATALKSTFAISVFTAFGLVCIWWVRRTAFLSLSTTKPVVWMWEHDGDTVITTDKVYKLSVEMGYEIAAACEFWNTKNRRPLPFVCAYRSTKRCDSGLTAEELKAILDSCSVRKVEMEIPMSHSGCYFLSFSRMWKFIHGPNSMSPTFPTLAR